MRSLDARRQRVASNPPLKCFSRVPSYGEKFDAILPGNAAWFVMGPRSPVNSRGRPLAKTCHHDVSLCMCVF